MFFATADLSVLRCESCHLACGAETLSITKNRKKTQRHNSAYEPVGRLT